MITNNRAQKLHGPRASNFPIPKGSGEVRDCYDRSMSLNVYWLSPWFCAVRFLQGGLPRSQYYFRHGDPPE